MLLRNRKLPLFTHGSRCGNWNSSVRIEIPHRVLFQCARVVIIQPANRHSLLTKEFCPIAPEIHCQIAWRQFANPTCTSFRLDARCTLCCEMEVRTARLTAPHRCTHRRRCSVWAGIRMNYERARVTLQFVEKRAVAHTLPLYQNISCASCIASRRVPSPKGCSARHR